MSAVPTEHSINPGETYGGGVSAACMRWITLEGNAQISQCAAVNGSGLYFTGSKNNSSYGELYAIGGSVDGDVVLGDTIDGPCTITGSGGTVFNGKVTVTPGSTIESGKFNGEVINNGTITGGMYNGKVTNNGTIIGGTFNGTITGTPALATGSGTENDPYQISTAEGLKWFRDKVNNAKTPDETKICAVLTADIDLNNEEWTPIGPSESSAYTGTFDGQGHTVKNLSVTVNVKPGRAGLFGCVIGGAIRKLTVAGSVSCTVDQGWCGGIAGYAERETIENCASLCTVSYTGKDARVGGIVGYLGNQEQSAQRCRIKTNDRGIKQCEKRREQRHQRNIADIGQEETDLFQRADFLTFRLHFNTLYPFMCCSLPPKFSKTNDFMLFSRTNEKQPIRSSNGIMRQNPPQKSGILMPIGFLGGMQDKVLLSRK